MKNDILENYECEGQLSIFDVYGQSIEGKKMTRYEYLKNASIEEMAEVLCDITDNTDAGDELNTCMGCLATKYCHNINGEFHNGFIDWLNKEVEYCENTKAVKVWD